MSKIAAIDVAVRLQLAADNKGAVDYARLLEGTAATGYQYDETTLQSFVFAVANRLRLDTPAWICAWEGLPLQQCLTARLDVLLGYIAAATRPVDGGT